MYQNVTLLLLFTLTTFDSVSLSLLVLSGDYGSLGTLHAQVRDFLGGEDFQIKGHTDSFCGYRLVLALSWAALKILMATIPLVVFPLLLF